MQAVRKEYTWTPLIAKMLYLSLLLHFCTAFAKPSYASVYFSNGKFNVAAVFDKNGAATANYTKAEEKASFFGELSLQTNSQFKDKDQAYAAGLVEGFLTHEEIYNNYINLKCQVNCSGEPPADDPVVEWLKEQDEWLHKEVRRRSSWDPLFAYVKLVRLQQQGLMDGYNRAASKDKQLTWWAFALLNGVGDLFDIIPSVKPMKRPNPSEMSYEELTTYRQSHGHCSALVKVTGDFSEMFMGHSSWFTYSAMLRIYKHYNFGYNNKAIKNHMTSFSSYPGFLSSLDDFYLLHQTELVMLQTTNAVLDPAAFDKVESHALLAWHRVLSANALATNGKQWGDIIASWNSGTYNNQYMVIDTKKFKINNALPEGLLEIVEQMPGLVVKGDATKELRRGYWPSYNVPYWEAVYNGSGYNMVDEKMGQTLGSQYELAPRAKIFRRDEHQVQDMDSFASLMRSNKFKKDPYSGGSPFGAICSRGDLDGKHPRTDGCYDTKVTSYSLFLSGGRALVVNGPTTDGGDLPAFSWESFGDSPHAGMPKVFNFTLEEFVLPAYWAME